jgi:hypothetical protein
MSQVEGIAKANFWVRLNAQMAWQYQDSNSPDAAEFYSELGRHTPQDRTSPTHYDEARDEMKVWDNDASLLSKFQHVWGERKTPMPGSEAYRATGDITDMINNRYIPQGNVLNWYRVDKQ